MLQQKFLRQLQALENFFGSTLGKHDNLEHDIRLWPESLTQNNGDYCVKMGSMVFQNCNGNVFFCKSFKQSDRSSEKSYTR